MLTSVATKIRQTRNDGAISMASDVRESYVGIYRHSMPNLVSAGVTPFGTHILFDAKNKEFIVHTVWCVWESVLND